MKRLKNLKARLLSLSLAFTMVVSLAMGMAPMNVRAANNLNFTEISVGQSIHSGDTIINNLDNGGWIYVYFLDRNYRSNEIGTGRDGSLNIQNSYVAKDCSEYNIESNEWKVMKIQGQYLYLVKSGDDNFVEFISDELESISRTEGSDDYTIVIDKEENYKYFYQAVDAYAQSYPAEEPYTNEMLNGVAEQFNAKIPEEIQSTKSYTSLVNSGYVEITEDSFCIDSSVYGLISKWKKVDDVAGKSDNYLYTGGVFFATEKIARDVVVQNTANGTVSATITGGEAATTVEEVETVQLTVTPNEGYTIGSVSVKDAEGNDILVKDDYSFLMPRSAVTISATFTQNGTAPETPNYPTGGNISDLGDNSITLENNTIKFDMSDNNYVYLKTLVPVSAISAIGMTAEEYIATIMNVVTQNTPIVDAVRDINMANVESTITLAQTGAIQIAYSPIEDSSNEFPLDGVEESIAILYKFHKQNVVFQEYASEDANPYVLEGMDGSEMTYIYPLYGVHAELVEGTTTPPSENVFEAEAYELSFEKISENDDTSRYRIGGVADTWCIYKEVSGSRSEINNYKAEWTEYFSSTEKCKEIPIYELSDNDFKDWSYEIDVPNDVKAILFIVNGNNETTDEWEARKLAWIELPANVGDIATSSFGINIGGSNPPTPAPTPTPDNGSNGGSSSSSDTSSTPSTTTPAPITVPVSNGGNDNVVNINASVSGETAKVSELTAEEINKVANNETNTNSIEINLSETGKNVKEAALPVASLNEIARIMDDPNNKLDNITIKLSTATVEVSEHTLKAVLSKTTGNDLRLVVDDVHKDTLNNTQKEAVKNQNVHQCIDAYFISNGVRIGDFQGGTATIRLPFNVPAGLNGNGFSVWYIGDDGTIEKHDTQYVNGELVFSVSHFSDYVVVYDGAVKDNVPKTGEAADYSTMLWTSILAIGVVGLVLNRQKRRQ